MAATPPSEPFDVGRLIAGCDVVAWRDFPGLPGVRVGFRALTSPEFEEVDRSTDPTRLRQGVRRALSASVVVEGSAGPEPFFTPDDLADLDPFTVDALFALFAEAHNTAHKFPASTSEIRTWAKAQGVERLRALYAVDLVAFYGLPSARHATTSQVLLYACLRKETPDGNDR